MLSQNSARKGIPAPQIFRSVARDVPLNFSILPSSRPQILVDVRYKERDRDTAKSRRTGIRPVVFYLYRLRSVTREDFLPCLRRRPSPTPFRIGHVWCNQHQHQHKFRRIRKLSEEPQRIPYCRFNHSYDDDHIK